MSKICFEKNQELDFRSKESLKTIRTNLSFAGNDVRVILIMSCTENEGKSSVSFYLANSFVQMGKKVLLIDADLRKSVFVGRYRIKGQVQGLSHYLSGQSDLDKIIQETDIEDLHMILAGKTPPNPSELLGTELFKQMISQVRNRYDYVIIDSPPLGVVIDAAVIAPVSDGAVFVIANDKVSKRYAKEVKSQLDRTHCRILGAILNKVDITKGTYYSSYYMKNYSKYYKKA